MSCSCILASLTVRVKWKKIHANIRKPVVSDMKYLRKKETALKCKNKWNCSLRRWEQMQRRTKEQPTWICKSKKHYRPTLKASNQSFKDTVPRGKRKSKQKQPSTQSRGLQIYYNNINGYHTKEQSFLNIIKNDTPDIIALCETKREVKKKVEINEIPGYEIVERNLKRGKEGLLVAAKQGSNIFQCILRFIFTRISRLEMSHKVFPDWI